MHKVLRKHLAILAVAGSLLGANQAWAAMISGPFSADPVGLTTTEWSHDLVFPKFDAGLGTLTSVKLEFASSLQTVITVNNTASGLSSGDARTELKVTVTDAGGYIPAEKPDEDGNLVKSAQIDVFTLAFSFSNLGKDQSVTSGTIKKSGSSTETYTTSDILMEFTGPGNIVLSANTKTFANISYTGGNANEVQSSLASLTGKVTYNYTPVPEPSTYLAGLGAFGILGVFGLRNRRK